MFAYCEKNFLLTRSADIAIILSTLFFCLHAQAEKQTLSFTDVALESGFQDRLNHGRGLVAADFNSDGWTDFVVINPSDFADDSFILWNDGPDDEGSFLFRKGQVLFSGQRAFTASAADYDNDGDPDLFVGFSGQEGIGLDYLFRNDNGVLVDVSAFAGIQGPVNDNGIAIPVATSSGSWADYNKDGYLDLFIAAKIVPKEERDVLPTQIISLILPDNLGWRDTLYKNNGDGTFTDVTKRSGIRGIYSSMSASWGDYDNDGWVDLIIPQYIFTKLSAARDSYLLYRNNHDGTFSEIDIDEKALNVGRTAYWATVTDDFNNDGWLDIVGISNSGFEIPADHPHSLLMNQGNWSFTNEAVSSGLSPPHVIPPRTMGCQAGDINSDGYPDLIMNNGWPWGGESSNLFLNIYTPETGVKFKNVSFLIDFPGADDPACTDPIVCQSSYPYRGHAGVFVDYDKDGDVDIAMVNGGTSSLLPDVPSHSPNRLFKNKGENSNNWLFIELIGRVSNRDAVGARIELITRQSNDATRKIYQEVKAGSCFSASGPKEIHFGLGRDEEIEKITVSWPSGIETELRSVDINQRIRIQERVLYHGDFNRSQQPGWVSSSGLWSISEGVYFQHQQGVALSTNTQQRRKNFSVVAKLSYHSGEKKMGLLGRVDHYGKRYYGAILSGNEARIYKKVRGEITPISKAISIDNMTEKKSYLVRLTLKGELIEMSVDGKKVSARDRSIRIGGIGLITNNTRAAVDYVLVHR